MSLSCTSRVFNGRSDILPVADPGFPVGGGGGGGGGGAPTRWGAPTSDAYTFLLKHVKMKEIDPVGGARAGGASPRIRQ